MNFSVSLEMVDLHRQFPNRNQRECKYYWEELYTLISAAGFDTIELNYSPEWAFGGRTGIPLTADGILTKYGSMEAYKQFLSNLGISKIEGVHFDPFIIPAIAGGDLEKFFGVYNHFTHDALQLAKDLDCKYLTVSPTPSIGALEFFKLSTSSGWPKAFLDRVAGIVNDLASLAAASGITLCIKNEYWSVVRGMKIIDFMKQLNSSIQYDFDTANIAIAGVDPQEMLKSMAGKIGIVHFTDTRFKDDAGYYKMVNPEYPAGHATQVFCDIGQGDVDLAGIYQSLQAAGYTGTVVCNCRQTLDICRALLRTRYHINNKIIRK